MTTTTASNLAGAAALSRRRATRLDDMKHTRERSFLLCSDPDPSDHARETSADFSFLHRARDPAIAACTEGHD